MGVINPRAQKKPYPPTGIGRGHASLPPKPGFAGKSLPRETDAIVLTPGGESLSFTGPLKTKRTYSSVASENIMRPMDPAVTNLTPQNRVSPSASAPTHHPVPRTITPPAESTVTKKKVLNEVRPDAINVASSQRSPAGPKAPTHQPNGSIDSQLVTNTATNINMDPTLMFRPEQQFQPHDHQHMANFTGLPPPDMYGHPMGHQFMPPHPHHHQHGFYNQHPYQGGTLTPPNTGNMFMMPMQPTMENMMFADMVNTSPGGNPQAEMFVPGYGGFQSQDNSGQHPGMHHPHFQPMGDMHARPDSRPAHQTPPPQHSSGFHTPAETQAASRKPSPAVRLRVISFVAPDEDSKNNVPDTIASTPKASPFAAQEGDSSTNAAERNKTEPSVSVLAPLEDYMSQQFLSKKLADVTLVLVHRGSHTESFPAHSFVLGRSGKLCQLLEHAEKMDSYSSGLARTNSTNSWADEVEGEESLSRLPPLKAVYSVREGVTILTFTTSVGREPFLLALKTLYGASGWEIDAFLDPQHPGHQAKGITEADDVSVIRKSLSSMSLNSHVDEELSVQVKMLERSIDIFCAGALLGLDNVMYKGIDGIKRWGFCFEGGGFERLLKFILDDVETLKNDSALSSAQWGFTEHLLEETINIFARRIPEKFKLDFRAPNSRFLNRLGSNAAPVPASTPAGQSIRQVLSTILLSVPFEVLKRILENECWHVPNGRRRIFELASSVVQERERRRKREIKALENSDGNYPDALCWEESAVSTFGHGAGGIEVARRRKGGPGGRMLWKVGRETN
jgi:hypothetical protein